MAEQHRQFDVNPAGGQRAVIMSRLLPHSRVHLHPGGHLDLVVNTPYLMPAIEGFSRERD